MEANRTRFIEADRASSDLGKPQHLQCRVPVIARGVGLSRMPVGSVIFAPGAEEKGTGGPCREYYLRPASHVPVLIPVAAASPRESAYPGSRPPFACVGEWWHEGSIRDGTQPLLKRFRASLTENKMLAFIRRFLLHYGIYRRYPLGQFPALRNAWRVARP